MSNSIYIAENSKDMFNIDIPAFDAGDVTTTVESPAPMPEPQPSEFDFVLNKSLTSFGVTAICIVVFILFALMLKKKNPVEESYVPHVSRTVEPKKQPIEVKEEIQQEEDRTAEHALYRYSSKKRSSLSTPTSINRCIRAFLENTKEN